MEPTDNKQLVLQKAISAHEQAAASLADLISGETPEERYATMLARIGKNIEELHAAVGSSRPGDQV